MNKKFQITDETRCYVCKPQGVLIDFIHPYTGKTLCGGKSQKDLIGEFPNYPTVEEMSFGGFLIWKAEQQRTPISWDEEVTRERFYDMLECLPPAAGTKGWKEFLIGEPYDHDALSGEPRYQGFRQTSSGYFASSRPLTVTEFGAEFGE